MNPVSVVKIGISDAECANADESVCERVFFTRPNASYGGAESI